jgi:hypothetical protein
VQTRIIVSSRGAYTVGNLDALIESMTDEQRITYKRAIIHQMLALFEAEIAERAHSSPALHDFLTEITRWLDTPTETNVVPLRRRINTLAANIPLDFALQKLAFAIDLDRDFPRYVRGIIDESPDFSPPQKEVLIALIADWQLEAAWALLRGSPVPAEPATDSAALDMLLSDAHWCYHQRLLNLLVRHFSLANWVHFRRAILYQALWLVESGIRADQVSASHTSIIKQAHGWLDQPHTLTTHDYQQAVLAVGLFRRKNNVASDAMNMLVPLFNPDAMPEHQALHDAMVVTIIASLFAGAYADDSTVANRMRRREQAHQWQIEAAWAIYNHAPIPAFITTAAGE